MCHLSMMCWGCLSVVQVQRGETGVQGVGTAIFSAHPMARDIECVDLVCICGIENGVIIQTKGADVLEGEM